jgi:hypothetical protein
MRVEPVRRRACIGSRATPLSGEAQEVCEVVVVGERWIGPVGDNLGMLSVRLARAAGAELLSVRFSRDRFVGASSLPLLDREPVVEAVLQRFGAYRS